jgi:adenosylcobinamide-GDP ribazoletransferase
MSERPLQAAAFWPKSILTGPLAALELLTVLRLRRPALLEERDFGLSQAWFPAVGLGLGACLVGLAAATDAYFSGGVQGWLLAAALVVLSGGLHIDGLADTVDGLMGGRTREQRLAIMHEGTVGALGAAAVVLVLGLKAGAFASAAGRNEFLVLVPALSRWTIVVAIAAFPYARPEGLGRAFHANAFPWPLTIASATLLGAVLVLAGPAGLIVAGVVAALALLAGHAISRSLGGLTGDVYGAINELAEVAALLAFLVLATEGLL